VRVTPAANARITALLEKEMVFERAFVKAGFTPAEALRTVSANLHFSAPLPARAVATPSTTSQVAECRDGLLEAPTARRTR